MRDDLSLLKLITTPGLLGGGGWSPAQLSNLVCWLQRDTGLFQDAAGLTPCVSDGDVVGLWQDQSGEGNDLSQSTTANKPTYRVASFDGSVGVRFITDDFLTGGAGWDYAPLFTSILVKPNVNIDSGTLYGIYGLGTSAADRVTLTFGQLSAPGARLVAYSDTGVGNEEAHYDTDIASGTKCDVRVHFTAAETALYLGGTLRDSDALATTAPPISSPAEFRLGQRFGAAFSDPLNGDIAEFIVCSSIPSAGDLVLLDAYMGTLSDF